MTLLVSGLALLAFLLVIYLIFRRVVRKTFWLSVPCSCSTCSFTSSCGAVITVEMFRSSWTIFWPWWSFPSGWATR